MEKWGGNYVTIEHTAPNGYKYLSSYIHLRNGFTHDLEKVRNTSGKYKKFADRSNPSRLSWGTEAQKIQVKKGQKVKSGQLLGYAGNTGSGGIGAILKDDGTFTDNHKSTTSFNVHLHFTLYVKDTRSGKTGWVNVDPYGVYNKKVQIDCYDLGSPTPYARLFAPFYPSFHNIPLTAVNKFWGYYTGMGMSLQTISIDRSGGKLLASGSFQWGLSKRWYARFYMTANSYQNYFNYYRKKGYRPRQIQVTNDSKGGARFSVIWEKHPSGQRYYAFHNRIDSKFTALWNEYVKKRKWHLAEHTTYTVNGKRYHAGIFVNKPNDNGFYMYYGLSGKAFNAKFKELYKKWQLHSMHLNGNTVGGVWRPKKQSYAAYYGMTVAQYQERFNRYSKQGMRLYRLQSYNNATRFAAIWVK